MIAAAFDYYRPSSLADALTLLAGQGDDARALAGGHSLVPAMKLRLAAPRVLVDLSHVPELRGIVEEDGSIVIGAMTTHAELAASPVLAAKCPLFARTAPQIGDVQVRNKGTIGGSLAHADPAADWPPVVLALDAELEIAAANGSRRIPATEFFKDIMQTALRPGELLRAIRVRSSGSAVAYVKTEQKASGFALCGVAAVADRTANRVAVAITGVSAIPFRARDVERALQNGPLTPERIADAARSAVTGAQTMSDIHGSQDYRAHLARVNVRRAIERAIAHA